MFMFQGCPHCKRAHAFMEELFAERPELREVPLTVIDERKDPATADKYDYYYVPTFFVGEEKVHEGKVEKNDVERVFTKALEK